MDAGLALTNIGYVSIDEHSFALGNNDGHDQTNDRSDPGNPAPVIR